MTNAKKKGKIVARRANDRSILPVDAERMKRQRQLHRNYGRADIPTVVDTAARNYRDKHHVSLKAALERLIADADSLDALTAALDTDAKKAVRKERRERKRAEQAGPAVVAIYKVTRIVGGGAPSLGGVTKPISVPPRKQRVSKP